MKVPPLIKRRYVDIEKHLRGINEFVYNGTKFIITQPLKKVKND